LSIGIKIERNKQLLAAAAFVQECRNSYVCAGFQEKTLHWSVEECLLPIVSPNCSYS